MKLIQIRLTPEQYARISAAADYNLETVTGYCRRVVAKSLETALASDAKKAQKDTIPLVVTAGPVIDGVCLPDPKTLETCESWEDVVNHKDFIDADSLPDEIYFKFHDDAGNLR